MHKLPMNYGIEAFSVESLVGICVSSLLEKKMDRALKAIADEAVMCVLEAETDQKVVQFVQRKIKDFNPDSMSEALKNYIWDALKVEIDRSSPTGKQE